MTRIVQVDAFTSEPYRGNPAAVCVTPEPRPESWMRDVAREMNLAETAFLVPKPDGSFHLRWFTPAVEVKLCGHATLASAHVLWEDGHLHKNAQARFHTLSGLLTADLQPDGSIEMDFPSTPIEPADAPPQLTLGLGLNPVFAGMTEFDYFLEAESEAAVRALAPDFTQLKKMPVRGIIVTARGENHDFVSRFFAPSSGIDEDPVTGSAHCALGPYWAPKLKKQTFRAFQASARGGEVGVRIEGDRIKLSGQAVTVMTGNLLA